MGVKRGISPVQRTLRELRQQGCLCDIVERFNSFAGPFGKRMDLFGFLDLIALGPDNRIIGIQACGQDFAAHKRKILENEYAPQWVLCARIQLWGWSKRKLKRGGKAMRWQARIEEITKETWDESN